MKTTNKYNLKKNKKAHNTTFVPHTHYACVAKKL